MMTQPHPELVIITTHIMKKGTSIVGQTPHTMNGQANLFFYTNGQISEKITDFVKNFALIADVYNFEVQTLSFSQTYPHIDFSIEAYGIADTLGFEADAFAQAHHEKFDDSSFFERTTSLFLYMCSEEIRYSEYGKDSLTILDFKGEIDMSRIAEILKPEKAASA